MKKINRVVLGDFNELFVPTVTESLDAKITNYPEWWRPSTAEF